MDSSAKTKFERGYRCIKCGNIQTYMRDTFADKLSDLPKCDIDGFVMMPASRGDSGPEVRRIDAKRYIGHDGWAMLVKVGDVVNDRKVDLALIEHQDRTLPRRVEVLQGVRGERQEPQVRIGSTVDHQTRANGTELWIRFDESIAGADPPRRALLGPHPQKQELAIAATSRIPHPGDREQRGPALAPVHMLGSPDEALMGMFKPETLVDYLDKTFPTTRWHETGLYFDRSLHGQKLAVFAQMLQQLDPHHQPSDGMRVQYVIAREALEAFVRQKADKLETFQALNEHNPIAVIRDVLITMSGCDVEKEETMSGIRIFISHSSERRAPCAGARRVRRGVSRGPGQCNPLHLRARL